MTPSDLRYQVSREWLEAEILAGRPISHRRHSLTVDLDSLEPEHANRLEAIVDGVIFRADSERATVLDSGIDPTRRYGPSDDKLVAMDEPVVHAVGELPEISSPTDDLDVLLKAWEDWKAAYCAESLNAIDALNQDLPDGKNPFGRKISWGGIRVPFGPGSETTIRPEDGSRAMRDARAAWEWAWAAQQRFGEESVAAAKEATTPALAVSQAWIEAGGPEEIAQHFLECAKKMHAAAKAHDCARRGQIPDFDSEMERWAAECGSNRLQLGIEDGYRMNSRYMAERIAAEAPGFFAMPVNSVKDHWARRASSPSEQALRLRRRVQAVIETSAPLNFDGKPSVEILTVIEPPAQMYLAHQQRDAQGNLRLTDFPSKKGWPWFYDEDGNAFGYLANSFEAVVVKNWLGRFHLIGAVADEGGHGPSGIWAVPEIDRFHDDGTVNPQDPDAPEPKAAKRKPPNPGEDEIPF